MRSPRATATSVEVSPSSLVAAGEGLAAVVEVGSPPVGLADGLVGPAASTGPGPSRNTRMRRPPTIPIAGTERGPPARGICHWTAPDATSIP